MDKKEDNRQGFVCFGAGKRGERTAGWARSLGTAPACFIDNSLQKAGTLCAGIPVEGPGALWDRPWDHILITCDREAEIRSQLFAQGVPEYKIVTGRHNTLNHLLFHAAPGFIRDEQKPSDGESPLPGSSMYCVRQPASIHPQDRKQQAGADGKKRRASVLFDLQNGLVLGGVETWTYSLARSLREAGVSGLYLTTDTPGPSMPDQTCPVSVLPYRSNPRDKDRIRLCMDEIEKHLPCTVLCNFPQYTFWSACLMKQKYPDKIKVLAVQHSDDPLYYEAYGLWREYVDCYVTLSARMEERLTAWGLRREKTVRMDWKVPCPSCLTRSWSGDGEPLHIGYAGRVTVTSKRADLLTELSLLLRKQSIPFVLEIAGEGDYSKALRESIRREKLEECVKPLGYIDRETLPVFWGRQDIMISCSEREGHSLSQREAMAQGAVPVVTDVSGAQDDIKDGENGFIVDVGALGAAADKIAYLHANRDALVRMGRAAHQGVLVRQRDTDQKRFWLRMLKEVWEPCK